MPGGVAGERPVKAVPYADAWNSALRRGCDLLRANHETFPRQNCLFP